MKPILLAVVTATGLAALSAFAPVAHAAPVALPVAPALTQSAAPVQQVYCDWRCRRWHHEHHEHHWHHWQHRGW